MDRVNHTTGYASANDARNAVQGQDTNAPADFSSVIVRLEGAVKKAAMLREQAAHLRGALLGDIPPNAPNPGAGGPLPSAVVPMLADLIDDLDRSLNVAATHVDYLVQKSGR